MQYSKMLPLPVTSNFVSNINFQVRKKESRNIILEVLIQSKTLGRLDLLDNLWKEFKV